mmetsp:Transcript_32278/g.67313  ORF Transcript_32278/g.67313 Transcript_32278/m.67313 type:complete len:99 (-) Transcript_32278:336-632(-)
MSDSTPPSYSVDSGEFYAEWSRCHSFQYQRDQLYRFGRGDDCSQQWNDYLTAMRAKWMTRDPQTAQELVEGTHLKKTQRQSSPTLGMIWEAKETPSWE